MYHYYAVSPRGFNNEVMVYAIDAADSQEFAELLDAKYPGPDAWTVRVKAASIRSMPGNGWYWAVPSDVYGSEADVTVETAAQAGRELLARARQIEALEDRGPGRPPIGPAINMRLPADMLAQIDGVAAIRGQSRAETIRDLLASALGLGGTSDDA